MYYLYEATDASKIFQSRYVQTLLYHVICLLSRNQCCRLADESRASGTFTTTLLSYGTGLLFLVLSKKVDLLSKYPAA